MRLGFKVGLTVLMLVVFSLKLSANTLMAPGKISGYVLNYYGVAVSGAIVGIENGPVTTSAANGYFILENVLSGEQTVGCGKTGYNTAWAIIDVIPGDTVFQNFTLTQPAMLINPLLIDETINPGEYYSTQVSVLNNGSGPLNWQAAVNYISMPVVPCQYAIALCDTWGDGWNGCSVDVIVNDIVVLDNITLSNGSGPLYFYFSVISGDEITTDFNPGPFITEPYYFIYNAEGEQIWFSPASNNGPPDVQPGQLIAACAGGEWLTLNAYEGDVPPFGGVDYVPVHLNAYGLNSGETYNADIHFTSTPFVGEMTIPVTMNIQGNEIICPENLNLELIDPLEGEVELNWSWVGDAFQFFLIKRDGAIIATTTSLSYTDMLAEHGSFCYTVQAVYNEGLTSPAGPECIEWPDPVLSVDPDDIEGWVWSGFTADVFTTVSNLGEGALSYTFPEFAALELLKDPDHPIVLGAGGPDDFGYVWIDSDEPGGPEFIYTNISTTGIPVFGLSDDNIVGPFNISFDFYFYGEVKTQFWINSNGCIGFTSNKITIGNTTLPTNSSVYIDFIAWMWDDLVCRTGSSQVFYKSFHDKLVIQFKNYEHYGQPDLPINAEVVLYKNGKILLLYDNFAQGVITGSCTIGLQSSSPGQGLQVAYNTDYLHNGLAVFLRVPGDFIVNVEPAFGIIPENDSAVITITYDSKEYVPGPYTQELILESNDLVHPEYIIDNTMHVYIPAIFSGIVYDLDDEEPLNGVLVTAGPYQATTGEEGEYTVHVDQGSYDLVFEKLGYETVTVEDTSALQDVVTPVNTGMWDSKYPPGFVHAGVMDNDSWCELTWSLPQGPYEIIMDDGQADDFFVYAHAGSWNAVKFTPSGYPATVIGGSFYVGDGSFPGPFLGTDFGVAVFDDNGVNGLPGSMIDSNGVTVNNSGWVSLDGMNAVIEEGSFFLAMYQAGNVPHAAPIGVDTDNPTYFRSYSKYQSGNWTLSPLQDFMIRAWINGPEGDRQVKDAGKELRAVPRVPDNWKHYGMTKSGTFPETLPGYEIHEAICKGIAGMGNRDVLSYQVARYTDFDIDDPLAGGNFTEVASTENLYYSENGWAAWPQGWYAFAVRAFYTSGEYSEYVISNIVGHLMDCSATFNITLTTGLEPENVEITLKGLDYPYETFNATTSSGGTAEFDMVWKGRYNITVYKIGFEKYIIGEATINDDIEYNIILSEKKYAPSCLAVDPVSLIGTWCEPQRTALNEGFENPQFPTEGWQSLTAGENTGWYRSNYASSDGFEIPPWDGYYAVVNNDIAGSENNGCCDYLITPPLDLRESEGYALYLESFYNGDFGQLAYIEYSLDEGETWEVLYQLQPDTIWSDIELDLNSFSGMTGPANVWFAFHSDDGPSWASGWAIDNVSIRVPAPAANYLDFAVFLDNAFVGITTETSWDFAPLAYGQTYTASVAAHYSSGLSAKDYFTFESKYLYPPQNLAGYAPDDAAILEWDPPGAEVPYNLYGYNIYRDDIFIDYINHDGNWQPQGYIDQDLEPGIYEYTVTGVYDLKPYGLPGETGESMKAGPVVVTVDYCAGLEFIETWDYGSFSVNGWIPDGPNWAINNLTGNPAPVAEFNGIPAQSDYEISLESYPFCAVGLTEGKIWLEFDLALNSFQATGQEFLQVQVWNWDSKEWTLVSEYSNIPGNFSWTQQVIDISTLALDNIIKIRFIAMGSYSPDIRGWFIDNIHVYRKCEAPAGYLSIDPNYFEGIRLTWEFPESGIDGPGNGDRDLAGYLVYRSTNGENYELLTETYTGLPYVDPDTNLVIGSVYCYKICAAYESETDQCISGLSNEACVIWTGVGNDHGNPGGIINLYPNPASDHFFIISSEEILRATIYNALCTPVFDKIINDKLLEINATGYAPGFYVVRIESVTGITSLKVTIQR